MTGRCQECGDIATCFIRNPVTGRVQEWCATCAGGDDQLDLEDDDE